MSTEAEAVTAPGTAAKHDAPLPVPSSFARDDVGDMSDVDDTSGPEVLEALGAAELSVIWLHGMGQGPEHMTQVARRLSLPESGVRGVFPRAPAQSVSQLTGRRANSWFLQSVHKLWLADLPSLLAAEQRIRVLIDAEVERFGAGRVVLAGFSQGAVMALYCGLRYRLPLAGIATYAAFPMREVDFFDPDDASTAGVPIWMGHGVRDWVVPYQMGKELRLQLTDRGHPVTWNWYRGEHEVYGGVSAELAAFFESLKQPEGIDRRR